MAAALRQTFARRIRPRRSCLFMPGSSAKNLDKARELPCDALIFDLEDAVAMKSKERARKLVAEVVLAGGYGNREVMVRVNALDTPWGGGDVVAVVSAAATVVEAASDDADSSSESVRAATVDAIVLPKVESAADVQQLQKLMETHKAPPNLGIACMIETPKGVLNSAEIAASSNLITCLIAGTSDLAKELRLRHTPGREPLLHSLSHCVLAARAHGVGVLDGVCLDLDNEAELVAQCRQGRDLGFDGKTLIHPSQISAANEAFGPSPEVVEQARRTIAAYKSALEAGDGVAVVGGRLVESLHAEEAEAITELAMAIEGIDGPPPSSGQ
eukprot:TRINITY_DN75199_c0_g1_i1.p1 TRINITY_DN75199_c0_g1~~TRINITY_DN75199_c0_g1_i1.p1  ORF type:complete len:367 (-),score=56.27 TRINITY_DN75199_c0_g1_i1:148-1134(-)